MTSYQDLEKNIKSYHRLLAMYGLTPFAILCVVMLFLFFHNKSSFYDYLPILTGLGSCSLLTFCCMMFLSYSFVPEIIRNVNDCWEEFIKKDLIEKHYNDVIEYQGVLKQLIEDERLMNDKINKIFEEYESKNSKTQ
jgi:hypothetical protein